MILKVFSAAKLVPLGAEVVEAALSEMCHSLTTQAQSLAEKQQLDFAEQPKLDHEIITSLREKVLITATLTCTYESMMRHLP